jgi:hypothetical protein
MSHLIAELIRLLDNLEEEDWEENGRNRDSGKKKYEARRRIRRVSSILDQVDEQPFDTNEDLLVNTEQLSEDTAEVTVDTAGAEIEWQAGEPAAIVSTDSGKAAVELPFPAGSVEKTENIATTTFTVTAA